MQVIGKLLFIEINPAFVIQSPGLVNDFILNGIHLYVANDEGSVEIFDIQTQKKVYEIFYQTKSYKYG